MFNLDFSLQIVTYILSLQVATYILFLSLILKLFMFLDL